ncbi:MAG: RNA-binding S4 domain-containing protein, partial [Psychromonas sp.]
ETQKRKKVYAGDLITFNDLHYQIVLKGQTDDYEVVRQDQYIEDAQQKNKQESKQVKKSDPAKAKKVRKAISF